MLIKLGFLRLFRRIKHSLFFIIKCFTYGYETCDRCGVGYRLLWQVKDEIWNSVFDTECGCYCPTCFIEIAENKNIFIKESDIIIKPFYYK